MGIVLDDLDTCDILNQDTIFYDLTVELPDNSGPKLTSDKEITDSVNSRPNFSIVEIETNLSGSYSMNLFSDDLDNDTLIMNAEGVGFNLEDINGLFSSTTSARIPALVIYFATQFMSCPSTGLQAKHSKTTSNLI